MLRATYYVVATILLLGLCQQTSTYGLAVDDHFAVVIADGPAPPPPLPLAAPTTEMQVADGPAPPPPLPLALPAFPVSPVQA